MYRPLVLLLVLALGGCARLLSPLDDGSTTPRDRAVPGSDATRDLASRDRPLGDAPGDAGHDRRPGDLAAIDAPAADARPPDARPPDARPPETRPPDLLPADQPPAFVPVVAPAFPAAASAFLGTIARSATSIYSLPDTPCSGSSCRHIGWMRKVVLPIGSCGDVGAKDALGAFVWRCVVVGGKATLFSHLRPETGLRELVSPLGWLPNQVKIVAPNVTWTSALLPWWNDPVLPLPDNSAIADGVATLGVEGAIYVLAASRATTGYAIAKNRVAVVTLGDAVLRHNGSTIKEQMINTGAKANLWIEALADGNNTAMRFMDLQMTGSHVRRTAVANTTTYAFSYLGAASGSHNLFFDVRLSNLPGSGFYTLNTQGDVFQRIFQASANTLFFAETAPFTATQVTVVNSSGGVAFYEQANATVHNAALINSGQATWGALLFKKGSGGVTEKNTASQIASLHGGSGTNGASAVGEAGTLSSKLGGVLLTSGSLPCSAPGGAGAGFLDGTCTTTGADGSSSYGVEVSTALLRTGRSAASSFFAKVTTDDLKNPDDTAGVAAFSAVSEWHRMENPLRFWGKASVAAFPAEAQRGRCSTGNCQIWDYRLKASDTTLLNRSFDGAAANPSFAHGDACPAGLGGDRSLTDQIGRSYLAAAVELLGMGGDDDGLCESGETCLYTPNFGYYQGHGDLFTKQCAFQANGGLSGISIYAYPLNGY